jgi:putative ABC transport system permease protein
VKIRDTLTSGFDSLLSHRLRSLLTVLGILIGIAAVILTVGFGEGASSSVSAAISSLGSNLLIVSPGSTTNSSGVQLGFGSASSLSVSDAQALSSKYVAPDVAGAVPVSSGSEELVAGSKNWTTLVTGTTAGYLFVRSRSVTDGRFFTSEQVADGSDVVVLGPTTAQELDVGVGSTVDVNGLPLQVIGILDSAGSSGSTNEDDVALVPITTAQLQILGSSGSSVSTIYVKAVSNNLLSAAYQEVNHELLALHHISTPADADFTITTQQAIVSTATSVDSTLTELLAGIAALSLLVGGIGVMNIMLVAVTERVREIGLRKALGASSRAIRRQFLTEASMLGLTGGLVGALLGSVGAELLPHLADVTVSLSGVAIVGAVVVAVGIGLISGVYPATRAARLAPIDALRNE